MRKPWRFTQPPRALRRAGVRLDNLALVPAKLLPYKQQWQALANRLPQGGVLIILPPPDKPQHKTLEKTAALLKAKGCRVTTVPAELLGRNDQAPG